MNYTIAGALSALITQPLQVIKTLSIHKKKIHPQFILRGMLISMVRSGFGFWLYRSLLSIFTVIDFIQLPISIAAALAKITAITVQYPVTYIKNRVELNGNFWKQVKQINNTTTAFRGFFALLCCQSIFSAVHYTLFISLVTKDLNNNQKMIYGYFIAFGATIASHPFQVLRNLSVNNNNGYITLLKQNGLRVFYAGLAVRILRKPLNTALCWHISQALQ